MKLAATWRMGRPSRQRDCARPLRASGRMTAPAMRRCSWRYSRRLWRLGGDFPGFDVFNESPGFERLAVNFLEGRNVGVPFQQGGRRTRAAEGALVEPPDRVNDRMVVRVQ